MKHIMGPNSRSSLTNVQEGDSQPNAVDLRIGSVYYITNELFEISDSHKRHRAHGIEIHPDDDGYFNLMPGSYEVVMQNVIEVGQGEAGFVITRSTLNRNGLFLTSGLYDTGYKGVMAGVLHVNCGPARIQKGTRIGQYLSFDAEAIGLYDGDYGINKKHDEKYAAGV